MTTRAVLWERDLVSCYGVRLLVPISRFCEKNQLPAGSCEAQVGILGAALLAALSRRKKGPHCAAAQSEEDGVMHRATWRAQMSLLERGWTLATSAALLLGHSYWCLAWICTVHHIRLVLHPWLPDRPSGSKDQASLHAWPRCKSSLFSFGSLIVFAFKFQGGVLITRTLLHTKRACIVKKLFFF